MSSSSNYYRAESETKKGVTNTPKLLYKPRDCYCETRAEIKVVEKSEKSKGELYYICRKERAARCGFFDWCLPVEWTSTSKIGGWGSIEYTNRYPECIKFRKKPLPLEEEMRILFGSNTATGEHMHTPNSRSVPVAPKDRTINLELDNIDAMSDNDAEVQELVHPLEDVSKKRRVDGSAMNKAKDKKCTMGSTLEACMQQICGSTDSASSPSSVHHAPLTFQR
ncbi:hypothetical protein RHMOL_Rhmol01G0281300 [Rhododendron molle]|uniref:Uncharacterized protein n=1 Tax=Rhododendron molle TaxID=49168 RepID=A0ACC0Q7Q5_RHOML|nr:hypothetical protein RHMOL_Rhmol01G0281300 [Rhododendron molle]